jgi:hypothetical protein
MFTKVTFLTLWNTALCLFGIVATRLKGHTERLFASTVSATYSGKQSHTEAGFRLADRSTLWWDAKSPDRRAYGNPA